MTAHREPLLSGKRALRPADMQGIGPLWLPL